MSVLVSEQNQSNVKYLILRNEDIIQIVYFLMVWRCALCWKMHLILRVFKTFSSCQKPNKHFLTEIRQT